MGGGIALQLALRHPEAIAGAFVPRGRHGGVGGTMDSP